MKFTIITQARLVHIVTFTGNQWMDEKQVFRQTEGTVFRYPAQLQHSQISWVLRMEVDQHRWR